MIIRDVAARLEVELQARIDAGTAVAELVPGLPLGGARDAQAALRELRSGAPEGIELTVAGRALQGIVTVADLDEGEHRILALTWLVNLDDRIGRGIGVLHDDASRTRPSVGLAARILAGPVSRERLLQATGPDCSIARLGLVTHVGAYGDPDAPWSNRELVLHPRVVEALLRGSRLDTPDSRLAGAFQLELIRGESLRHLKKQDGSPLDRLAALSRSGRRVGLLCVGRDLEDALDLGREFARQEGLRLLRVDVTAALALGETLESLLRSVCRESILTHALPVWMHLPMREMIGDESFARRTARILVRSPSPLLIHAERSWTPPPDVSLTLVAVTFPVPGFEERVHLWADGNGNGIGRRTAEELAGTMGLPRTSIAAARAEAAAATEVLGGEERAQLVRAAHRQASARLVRFATRILPRAQWSELVAPRSVLCQLQEVEWRVAHRVRVMEESGFARSASGRKGFVALFTGASGTGKTLAAEIIAGTHGFDLFKVDLAALVSKYIGETEKHLSQVFEDAESAHAILFFDEADAVFGKRSQVRDAHDRYANLEVNYLLQRVEAYEGAVILATNLRQNMDEAFLRRLDIVVELPFPDENARTEIWRRIWPADVILSPDIELKELALRHRFSGGSIRNVAIDAAFRAVSRDGHGQEMRIERKDLILALGREYQKLGRPVTRAEFGSDYSSVVQTLFSGLPPSVHDG